MKKIELNIKFIAEEYNSGKTVKELSIENFCSVSTIRSNLKKFGIKLENPKAKKDVDILKIQELIENGEYPKDIAKKMNISISSVWYKMKSNGIKYNRNRNYTTPIVGTKFNRFTFLKDLGHNKKTNRRLWLCRCECGVEKKINYYQVREGEIKSCGCYHKDNQKKIHWKGYEEISGKYWSQIKKGAQNRAIEFNLDIKYIWDLYINQKRKCALSSLEIGFENSKYSASLDRIDSSIGYIKGNVQWIVKEINYMKMNLQEKDFIFFCKKISNNEKK